MQKGARLHRECSVLNLQNNPKHIRIGAYSQVRGKLQLFAHGGQIEVGEYCYVGENSYIWSAKRIKIGDRVLIAHGVNIHDNISHPLDALSRHNQSMAIIHANHPSSNLDLDEKPVVIEDDVWIGFNATILRGITIGQGAIVGACSVVTENVPAWSVVVGNPAKVIKTLSPVKVK